MLKTLQFFGNISRRRVNNELPAQVRKAPVFLPSSFDSESPNTTTMLDKQKLLITVPNATKPQQYAHKWQEQIPRHGHEC